MAEPVLFRNEDTVYYADSCEPLKAAAAQGEIQLDAWSRGSYPGLRLPTGVTPEVRSLGVWDASREQSWGLETHCNEGIEFTLVSRGQVGFRADGKYWTLRKGSMTITRPWQLHSVGNPHVTASRLAWLILDVNVRRPNQPWQWPEWLVLSQEDVSELTNLLRHNEQPVWQANDEIARCFDKLTELLADQLPEDGETRLKLYVNELLIAVMEMLQQKHIPLDRHLSSTHRAVELFLSELPKHVAHDWDLDAMAEQCGLSRSQFSAYCKQIKNMTPIEYLNHSRVDAAVELLRDCPDISITEVAFSCGFNSSQYFATVFRRHVGCSPTEYREEYETGAAGDISPGNRIFA